MESCSMNSAWGRGVHFRLLADYMALRFKSKINHKDAKNTKFFLKISVRSVPLF